MKSGFNRNGTQRYRCKRCQRYFTPKTNEQLWDEHMRRWEVERRVFLLYLEGRSLRSIARQVRVHHQTVGRWVTSWTKELRGEAIKLYQEERSVYYVYRSLSQYVNFRTVSMWIRAALPEPLKEEALRLHLENTPLRYIKRALGVDTERTVRKWIRQAKSETTGNE